MAITLLMYSTLATAVRRSPMTMLKGETFRRVPARFLRGAATGSSPRGGGSIVPEYTKSRVSRRAGVDAGATRSLARRKYASTSSSLVRPEVGRDRAVLSFATVVRHTLSAARSFALRARAFIRTSSGDAVTGFFVSNRNSGVRGRSGRNREPDGMRSDA